MESSTSSNERNSSYSSKSDLLSTESDESQSKSINAKISFDSIILEDNSK